MFGLPVYALGGLAPRQPDRVVFGGNGDRFTDNARYLFVHMAGDDRFRCTWITGDRAVRDHVRSLGFHSELRWSPNGVRAALGAGWFVYGAYPSDINFWLSRGATLLNLWHGIPLKAIEFDVDTGPLGRLYRSKPWSPIRLAFLDRFRRPDLVLSPSRFLTERCFSSAFRVSAERCVEFGYPRTDHLFRTTDTPRRPAPASLVDRVDAGRRIIGYFPTWRDDGRNFLGDAGFTFAAIDRHLERSGSLLVFKAHPNLAVRPRPGESLSNVVVLDSSVDLNDVLPLCDVLVTDYSSVAFDFLLLDRPIVYFLPDHERYVGNRSLYFALDEMTAGPIVTTIGELYELLGDDLHDADGARRNDLRSLLWGDHEGRSCEQLADLIASSGS